MSSLEYFDLSVLRNWILLRYRVKKRGKNLSNQNGGQQLETQEGTCGRTLRVEKDEWRRLKVSDLSSVKGLSIVVFRDRWKPEEV